MTIIKLLKTSLFVGTIYGWMVPGILLGEIVQDLFPTAKLNNQDWVIEAGEANHTFDFVTIDGLDAMENIEEDLITEHTVQTTPSKATPQSDKQPEPDPTTTENTDEDNDTQEDNLATSSPSTQPELTVKHTNGISKPFSKHKFKKTQTNSTGQTKRKKTTRRGKCNAENPDIKRLSSRRYSVPKKVVKHYSTHWKEANRLAHLTWASQPNGERSGIRLKGISCRSPLKYIGLRRGDVVVSVNGMPVDTERSLLKIYGRLMFWKKMEVVVKRGAKTITLQYDIV